MVAILNCVITSLSRSSHDLISFPGALPLQLKLRRIYRITTVEGGFDKMQPLSYTYKAISMEKTNFKAYNPNLSSILENRSLQGNLQGNPRLNN